MAGIKQPEDKSHFILPDLGEGVHEAELVKWRVQPGERVEEHQTIAEMETDKALVEVPSPWSGIIRELHGKEGEIITVGSRLVSYDMAEYEEPREKHRVHPDAISSGIEAARHSEPQSDGRKDREDAGTVVGSMSGSMSISERFRRREPEHVAASTVGKALATPAVRRIAREMGVDIDRVPGSGRGGRVTASDVRSFAGTGAAPAATAVAPVSERDLLAEATRAPRPAPAGEPGVDGIAERIPFRGVRRKIAQALDTSVRTAVHFTVVDEADVTTLDRKRQEYSRVLGRKLSYLPFVMLAVCRALRLHPTMNANVDDENDEILIKGVINLGCAVDTDHGLMVPVIENADRLSIVELSDGVAEVARGCRDRTIPREQLVGGTFTISNVGSYGGRFATPIINYPEVGILAAGRVFEKVLTRDGMFYAGRVMPLSLSCDHRVVDGAEGARFLHTVVTLLESPGQLLG